MTDTGKPLCRVTSRSRGETLSCSCHSAYTSLPIKLSTQLKMPASAGRVKMPAHNKVTTSASMKVNSAYARLVADPYANAASADGDAAAASAQNILLEQSKGLMELAKMSAEGAGMRVTCKRCKGAGHLTFECRNALGGGAAAAPVESEDDDDDDYDDDDGIAQAASAPSLTAGGGAVGGGGGGAVVAAVAPSAVAGARTGANGASSLSEDSIDRADRARRGHRSSRHRDGSSRHRSRHHSSRHRHRSRSGDRHRSRSRDRDRDRERRRDRSRSRSREPHRRERSRSR